MTEEERLEARAAALDLTIPEAYRTAVLVNLTLIDHYASLINAFGLPERLDPACEYTP